LKQNRNKNKNKLLIETKKTKLKQIVFEFAINLDWTSLEDFFAKFYNSKIEFLCNFKLSTRLLNKNIISFYFYFARVLFAYIFFLKDRKCESVYK